MVRTGRDNDREGFYKTALEEVLGAEALLLGRRSYEFLASRWPSQSGELADTMNIIPKYVVSSTLDDPKWNNSTVMSGDVMNKVSAFKDRMRGEIVVHASLQLVRALIENDLVDELRLMVYPFLLWTGQRLFDETNAKVHLRLISSRTV